MRARVAEKLARAALPILDGTDQLLDRTATAVGNASRTVKFLRNRARFVSRPGDVFVASYPRSGTTWTQVITYLLVSGGDDLSFDHLAKVAPWWERSLAHRTDAAENLAHLPGRRVFKSHLPRRWLPEDARCLYVWRNPADVAVSYYHLYQRYLGFRGPFAEFFARFLRGDVQYGSWFRHVAGWRRLAGDPRVLILPYEDMRTSAKTWIRRIAAFLEIEVDDRRVAAIARHTDLSHMKAAHQKFDHVGELCIQWGIREGEFIREGKTDRGAGFLSPDQRAALARRQAISVSYPSFEWRLASFLH